MEIFRGTSDLLNQLFGHLGKAYDVCPDDPLVLNVVVALSCAFLCWIVSILSGNYSQVDRLWSVMPAVYAAVFARSAWSSLFSGGVGALAPSQWRLLAISALTGLWGCRLTYNFARKGGYDWASEDYRWPLLRSIIPPVLFQIFNVVFISFYQHLLLLLITLPAYVCYRSTTPFGPLDFVATGLFVTLLLGETIADQQQWNFQKAKHAQIQSKARLTGDFARGFITSGLFKYSRHPNFFCEISMWWCIYVFSVAASGERLNWSIVGAVLLLLLFQGSTTFTERVSSKKYPEYETYKRTVSRLIPWFPGDMPDIKSK